MTGQLRIILRKVVLYNEEAENIIIQLYSEKVVYKTPTFYYITEDQEVNWKFLIPNTEGDIEILLLKKNLNNHEVIIGHGKILPKNIEKSEDIYLGKIINTQAELLMDKKIIGTISYDIYLIMETKIDLFPTGDGWDLPNSYPRLDNYPPCIPCDIQHCSNPKLVSNNVLYNRLSNDFINAISKLLSNKDINPLIIYVYGSSSSGKSTLSNQLVSKDHFIVKIDQWQIESNDNIWTTLLYEIYDNLEETYGKNKTKFFRIKKNLFGSISFWLRIIIPILFIAGSLACYFTLEGARDSFIAIIIAIVSGISFLAGLLPLFKGYYHSTLSMLKKKTSKINLESKLGFLHYIRNEFMEFILPFLKTQNKELLLVIDNLDRCSYKKITQVKKMINLFTSNQIDVNLIITLDNINFSKLVSENEKKNIKKIMDEFEENANLICNLPNWDSIHTLRLIEKAIKEDQKIAFKNKVNKYLYHFIKDDKEKMDKIQQDINNGKSYEEIVNEILNPEEVIIKFRNSPINKKDLFDSLNDSNFTLLIHDLIEINNNLEIKKSDNNIITEIEVITSELENSLLEKRDTLHDEIRLLMFEDEISIFHQINDHVGIYFTDTRMKQLINLYNFTKMILPPRLWDKREILIYLLVLHELFPYVMAKLNMFINHKGREELPLTILETLKTIIDRKNTKSSFDCNYELLESLLTYKKITWTNYLIMLNYLFNIDHCLILSLHT